VEVVEQVLMGLMEHQQMAETVALEVLHLYLELL
jgi:hypothetical protein